jgi:hypothetical protein
VRHPENKRHTNNFVRERPMRVAGCCFIEDT